MKFVAALLISMFTISTAFCSDPNAVKCEYAGSLGNLSISVNVPVWPELFGSEIPVYPRGIVIPKTVNQESMPFYKTQLAKFLERILSNSPALTLTHLERCESEFALEADVKVNGLSLSRILIEEGLAAKKETPAIIPSPPPAPEVTVKTAPQTDSTEQAPVEPEHIKHVQSQIENPGQLRYCASKNSNIYHLENCPAARRISKDNLIEFDDLEGAIDSGRAPCKRCLPENSEN